MENGQFSTACSALLDEPSAPNSETVAKEMRDRHPPPRTEDVARRKLLQESFATTPALSLVQDAILLRAGLRRTALSPPAAHQREPPLGLLGRASPRWIACPDIE